MNSPVFTVTSDFSTPKPYFYQPHEISEDDEFSKYLSSLQTDISSLGKEVEQLRKENSLLKAQLTVIEKEKEKHILNHAKEKFELEKAVLHEKKKRKAAIRELEEIKNKTCRSTKKTKKESLYKDPSIEKLNKYKRNKSNTEIKTKLNQMELEHKLLKKKIKNIEKGARLATNKSSVLQWTQE